MFFLQYLSLPTRFNLDIIKDKYNEIYFQCNATKLSILVLQKEEFLILTLQF